MNRSERLLNPRRSAVALALMVGALAACSGEISFGRHDPEPPVAVGNPAAPQAEISYPVEIMHIPANERQQSYFVADYLSMGPDSAIKFRLESPDEIFQVAEIACSNNKFVVTPNPELASVVDTAQTLINISAYEIFCANGLDESEARRITGETNGLQLDFSNVEFNVVSH